jgi:shikimate dehydrogenase
LIAKEKILTGLIGRGIGQSLSPVMHEREADAQGIRLIYSSFDFAEMGLDESDLPRMLDALELAGFAGVNVTHPYKQAIIEHLDKLSNEARAIGAVNTVAFSEGQRTGYNTDVTGFQAAFDRSLSDASLDAVVQIGAGGGGSATAFALMHLGVSRLVIHDSDRARAQALAGRIAEQFGADRIEQCEDLASALAACNGLVNASPMGMAEYPGMAVPEETLRRGMWVAEIVYFPLETELLRTAKAAGCRVMDGSGMAVSQAVGAFEIFTGSRADTERMLAVFREHTT